MDKFSQLSDREAVVSLFTYFNVLITTLHVRSPHDLCIPRHLLPKISCRLMMIKMMVKVLVAEWYTALCNPMDCKPIRLLCPWNSPGKNTGVVCHSILQEILLTQGSNLGLPYCRQILYHLSHPGSP